MNAQQKILARLQTGSATASDLASLLACKRRTIPPLVSRLRLKLFRILGEPTSEVNNPRYTLVGGPGSLGASFVCPMCKHTIRLGRIGDHHLSCDFGPAALIALGVDFDDR